MHYAQGRCKWKRVCAPVRSLEGRLILIEECTIIVELSQWHGVLPLVKGTAKYGDELAHSYEK